MRINTPILAASLVAAATLVGCAGAGTEKAALAPSDKAVKASFFQVPYTEAPDVAEELRNGGNGPAESMAASVGSVIGPDAESASFEALAFDDDAEAPDRQYGIHGRSAERPGKSGVEGVFEGQWTGDDLNALSYTVVTHKYANHTPATHAGKTSAPQEKSVEITGEMDVASGETRKVDVTMAPDGSALVMLIEADD